MGFFVNLQKLLLLGRQTSKLRPTLAQYALVYQPRTGDVDVLRGWELLQGMLGKDHVGAGLTGLLAFAQANQGVERARVCFSADCEVGFELNQGTLIIDPHDVEPVSCSALVMAASIQAMLDDYDSEYV